MAEIYKAPFLRDGSSHWEQAVQNGYRQTEVYYEYIKRNIRPIWTIQDGDTDKAKRKSTRI